MPVSQDKLKAMKKKGKGQPSFKPEVDQSVLDALKQADTAEKKTAVKDIAGMTAYEREKRKKDKARTRVHFDCDPGLAEAIEGLQGKYRKKSGDLRDPFPKSDLIELLVVLGMRQLIENGGGLRRLMRMTASPHFLNRLVVPEIPDISEYNAENDFD